MDSAVKNVSSIRRLLQDSAVPLTIYIDRQLPNELRRVIDAQDVLQDTFFEAFQRSGEFLQINQDFTLSWLKTIVRHRIVDLLRMHRTVKRGSGKVLSEEEVRHHSIIVLLQDLAVYDRTPSQSASRREVAVLIEKSIGSLKSDYADAIRLRYIEGLSLGEAAERMGRSTDSAQKLCLRALDALRINLRTESQYA